ncbi:MAG: response regulator [Deltaproteobacteria bacterium]|nr:response regulator [Deltaproteobacteria bacterium]MBI3294262.1 response regulator [Deltaproteobacteria bacterium]
MKPNILIVDDKPENVLALEGLLREEDANIITANSGNEALALLLDKEVAVTLMDVQMPEMDGFETVSLIRQNRKTGHIPIIFVTAINKEEKYVSQGYELGAVDYLFKPLQPSVVRSKVRAFLELYRQKEELGQKTVELEKLNSALFQVNAKLEVSLRELRVLNHDLEQFTSVASHDLKAPLRTISMYLSLIENKYRGNLDADVGEYLRFAVTGSNRLSSLINDLLLYAKAGNRQMKCEDVDVNSILSNVLQDLKASLEEAQGRVEKTELPIITGDPTQLSQCFQNLIQNAIKYRGSKRPVIGVGATLSGNEWRFYVSDNGPGIPKDSYEKIFQLFHRLHSCEEVDGSGIGLAICRRVAERHGGRIWVESKPGKGSTFFFTIPTNNQKNGTTH